MAKPVSPIIPGEELDEVIYTAGSTEGIEEMPAFRRPDGDCLSRWHLTWKERLAALLTGNIYLWVATNNKPLQPLFITALRPETIDIDIERPVHITVDDGGFKRIPMEGPANEATIIREAISL